MNELKTYAEKRIQEFNFQRPISYDETLYGRIKGISDIEFQFKFAENLIYSCEREGNAGQLPDYEERDVAVYNAYVALSKASRCMNDFPGILKDSAFDSITQEQFDSWCNKLHDLNERKGLQNTRYASRPD